MKNDNHRALTGLAGLGLFIVLALSACSQTGVSADEDRRNPESEDKSIVEKLVEVIQGPETIRVPAGTLLTISVKETLSSETASAGSSFEATLVEPVEIAGQTVIDSGVGIQGLILEVERSKRVKGRARLALALDSVVLDPNRTLDMDTERLQIKAGSDVKKDAVTIGGSSALGAIIGAIAGGGDGAAKGAGIGAAAGTGYVLVTRGDEVKIPAGTKLAFVLANDLEVPAPPETRS